MCICELYGNLYFLPAGCVNRPDDCDQRKCDVFIAPAAVITAAISSGGGYTGIQLRGVCAGAEGA